MRQKQKKAEIASETNKEKQDDAVCRRPTQSPVERLDKASTAYGMAISA